MVFSRKCCSMPMLPRPIIVFDGEKLPAKAKEDQRRGQLREAARLRALELLQQKEKGEEVDDFLIQQKCQPYADFLQIGNRRKRDEHDEKQQQNHGETSGDDLQMADFLMSMSSNRGAPGQKHLD